MYRIAKSNTDDRRILFRNTAAKMHVHEAIVEKDFWVCLTLEYLFHQCIYSDAFAFKGGTSLSKAWHVIERFSEDIDLILDWRILGYAKEEPWIERSNKQQDLFNKGANANAARFIREELAPQVRDDLSRILGPVNRFVQHIILRCLYKNQLKSLRCSQNVLSGKKLPYFIMKHTVRKIPSYLPDIHDTITIYIVLPIHMSKKKLSQILNCYIELLSLRKNSIPVDGQNTKKPNQALFA